MNAEGHHHHEVVYPPEWEIWPLPEMCASQVLLDDISGKWAILTIAALSRRSARFNQLRRTLRGVTLPFMEIRFQSFPSNKSAAPVP